MKDTIKKLLALDVDYCPDETLFIIELRQALSRCAEIIACYEEALESIANSNGRGAEVYSAFDAIIIESKEALAKAKEISKAGES